MRTLIALLMLAPTAYGDHCRVAKQQVIVQNELVAVPFVAPLGVVITGSPLYSYRGAAQAYQQPQAASVDPDYADFLAWKAAKASQVKAAVVPQTLVQQHCVKCHSPGNPTSKKLAVEALDMSTELTSDQKLSAIKALLLGSMPPGKTIDAQLRSDLAAELSGVKPEVSK